MSRLSLIFVLLLTSSLPATVSAQTCWSSGGGDGDVWLDVTVTAGGSPAADVSVYLQPETYSSGYGYIWESACTDGNGMARFRRESNQSSNCYTSYYYGTYANYRSAHCQQYYYEHESSYSNYTLSLENYKAVAYPPYNSALAERYGNAEADDIDIDFEGSQSASIVLPEKNVIVRTRIVDDAGSAVTSGVTLYISGPTYSSKQVTSSFTDVYVVEGTYYIGAYSTDYQNSLYACISNVSKTIDDDDVVVEVNLTARRNNATVSGVISGSDGSVIENASVSVGNYNSSGSSSSCYAYGWDQADSNGVYSISLPAGNYTAWVYPPYNYSSGSSSSGYSSKSESVTLVSGETTTKNIVLQSKTSSISVVTRDSLGNAIANAWCSGWVYADGVNDWGSCQTNTSGTCSFSALEGVRYNVSCSYWESSSYGSDQPYSNYSNEGMQAIVAPATDVSFTFASWDHRVSFCLVDDTGTSLSNINGGGSIRIADQGNEYWYGTWISFDGSSCMSKKLASSTDYVIQPYVWGNTSYDPASDETEFTTGESGGSSSVSITMIPVDATVSGGYVDEDGNAIDLDANYISVYATKGSIWRQCQASTSGFTGRLSAGHWCFGYWLDSSSGCAPLSPGSSTSCLDITAGSEQSFNLTCLRNAYINVTAKDNQGVAIRWVWVEASPYSAANTVADDSRRMYMSNGCSTNDEGTCTITIGAPSAGITYYLKAYRPWSELNDENLTLPEEVSATVAAGETVDASTLLFRRFDGELAITATVAATASANLSKSGIPLPHPILNADVSVEESIVDGVWVSAFSQLGGYSEVTTDASGVATLKCVSGDVWNVFGISLVGSNLYISESAEVTCAPVETVGATAVNLKMNAVGTVPDSVTQTWDAGVANTLSLNDGFGVTCPASALGESSENVSCTVQPDPFLPYQSGRRPTALYGYDVTCNDSSGTAITSLSAECNLCLPINEEQLATLSMEAADQNLVYRDTSTDAYISLSSCTIDEDRSAFCCRTNHFTEFVLVGNGNLAGVDGDTEDATEEAERTGEEMTGEVGASAAGSCGCRIDAVGRFQLLDLMVWFFAVVPVMVIRFRRLCVASKPSHRSSRRGDQRHVM